MNGVLNLVQTSPLSNYLLLIKMAELGIKYLGKYGYVVKQTKTKQRHEWYCCNHFQVTVLFAIHIDTLLASSNGRGKWVQTDCIHWVIVERYRPATLPNVINTLLLIPNKTAAITERCSTLTLTGMNFAYKRPTLVTYLIQWIAVRLMNNWWSVRTIWCSHEGHIESL